ncbi:MAG: PhzF family phenazine biosynthesis protein, partial [Deltaproteobacteria bacterium]|nr:PhzF family phenazine biosynthesis protein [Deltaproteobacteria bacterium]
MGQRITVVDAFTHVAFSGNPAAVCVLTEPATD